MHENINLKQVEQHQARVRREIQSKLHPYQLRLRSRWVLIAQKLKLLWQVEAKPSEHPRRKRTGYHFAPLNSYAVVHIAASGWVWTRRRQIKGLWE